MNKWWIVFAVIAWVFSSNILDDLVGHHIYGTKMWKVITWIFEPITYLIVFCSLGFIL